MANPHIVKPAGVWRSVYELTDPGEFGKAVAGATLKVDFLARQQAAANIERFLGVDWAIDSYKAGVKARMYGELLPQQVMMCLVLHRGMRQYGIEVEAGYLLCNPPGVPLDGYFSPGFVGISACVPLDVWEECRLISGCTREQMTGFHAIPLPPEVFRELRALHATTRYCLMGREAGCIKPAVTGARLARAVAMAAWEHVGRQRAVENSPRNRFRLARRAEAWMRERIGEPFSMPEVCLALRVSRRELEYAFHTAFGESPRAFLESLRMNAVKAALRRADEETSVTEIALTHGINHLGRFSARYRLLFDEPPSETLRRGR